ncbi:MAG: hypothetical protein PHE17_16390 [Thiothrix sp.]|uniref:hypothetical protein n=1 Tax=Thiothrix sp. TaxID=1032 RepID=UPI00262F0C4F|nr:hypothetical protein [Thiothrix sp.]MDD5394595.1 hypothetical protein [Thiothrix sp.]
MKSTMDQTRVNRTVYWVAKAFAIAMLAAYLAALGMALHTYGAGDKNGALLWAVLMLLPLALLWLASVFAAPFIRDLDCGHGQGRDAPKTTPTMEG